ncbi:NifU family protein [Allokutzneria albata]|uniref:NifU-like domain-containing protein n=1 Tax=Allokutzneria albata TaxID=211114 RepID=A0A1G9WBN0_ALLAB|nr:NifU family protein [Allokutzneria albata]SDM81974.1 NifU-like domain-containing protein [Allokutzneria albata]
MTRNVSTVGDRIEELLGGLLPGESRQTAEELVRLLMELYGEGLARVVAVLREHDPALVERIAGDDVVAGLLLLHDLHPLDVDTRIRQGLDRARPHLGAHADRVEYSGVDAEGVVRLRLDGSRAGCPSATRAVREAIEKAVLDAAPETTGVEITGATTDLLQIGMGPPPGWRSGAGSTRWSEAS